MLWTRPTRPDGRPDSGLGDKRIRVRVWRQSPKHHDCRKYPWPVALCLFCRRSQRSCGSGSVAVSHKVRAQPGTYEGTETAALPTLGVNVDFPPSAAQRPCEHRQKLPVLPHNLAEHAPLLNHLCRIAPVLIGPVRPSPWTTASRPVEAAHCPAPDGGGLAWLSGPLRRRSAAWRALEGIPVHGVAPSFLEAPLPPVSTLPTMA